MKYFLLYFVELADALFAAPAKWLWCWAVHSWASWDHKGGVPWSWYWCSTCSKKRLVEYTGIRYK